MAGQDFAAINAGEPSLLQLVEEIVIDSHRHLYETEGRAWSKPVAYRWLRFEDPKPVARLQEGAKELRGRNVRVDTEAVEKACVQAAKHGFSY